MRFDWQSPGVPILPLSDIVSGDQPAEIQALRREFGITEQKLMAIDKAEIERRIRAEVARELADAQMAIADANAKAKQAEQEVRRVRDLLPQWAKIAIGVLTAAAVIGWALYLGK